MIAMTERKLAEKFCETINYPLLVPNNTSQAGWPDRFIQLPNSRIVACEFKVVSLVREKEFNLTDFRQTQVAWMANWQRNHGLGFLLIGINLKDKFIGYAIITQTKWDNWLTANRKQYSLDTVSMHWEIESIMEWFDSYIKDGHHA